MNRLRVRTRHAACPIILGGSLEALESLAPHHPGVIISDARVHSLFGDRFPSWPRIEVAEGEAAKTLQTVQEVYRRLLALGADRGTFVVGIGGGVVCDLAGFSASTYMRGLPFALAPTTLLAQADAAIGGKNGVNLDGGKNLVGTFAQPRFVLADFGCLRSLPPEEILNGMAEIIKSAAIADSGLFRFLERSLDAILGLDPKPLEKAVAGAVRVKTAIVSRDEREAGERRMLNFGHTLGHALEKVLGISHGRAVAMGMVAAARLSVKRNLLALEECRRLESLLARCRLLAPLPAGQGASLMQALKHDKKRESEMIHLVLLRSIGRAEVSPVSLAMLQEEWSCLP